MIETSVLHLNDWIQYEIICAIMICTIAIGGLMQCNYPISQSLKNALEIELQIHIWIPIIYMNNLDVNVLFISFYMVGKNINLEASISLESNKTYNRCSWGPIKAKISKRFQSDLKLNVGAVFSWSEESECYSNRF